MFKRKKIDISVEKNIIVGMILDDRFLRDIRVLVDGNNQLFLSPYFRIVANWCIEYYKKYEKAPQKIIANIFENRKVELRNENDVENVKDVLEYLEDYYLQGNNFNRDYYFDISIQYLKKRSLELLIERMQESLSLNELIKAENELTTYKRIEKPQGSGIDIFNDRQAIIDCLINSDEVLCRVPGELGQLLNDFYRGDLIAFGAPQKRGKTFYLMWFAIICSLAGLKVAYWTLEMKDTIMLRRKLQMMLGETKREKSNIRIPYFDKNNNIKYRFIDKKGISLKDALRIQKKLKKQVRTGGFRLFDLSSGGCTVEDIFYTIENLEYFEDFLVDIVVIDYADILEPEKDSPREYRNRLNHTWLRMKRLAQNRNCLVVTASQMGKIGLKQDVDTSNIAEDIRKLGHVSHWINLNQSKVEKALNLMRISVSGRHDEFNPMSEVVVLECRDIGRPVLDSRFKRDIPDYKKWIKEQEEEIKGADK